MNHRLFIRSVLMSLLLAGLFHGTGRCGAGEVIEVTDSGTINWTRGEIVAVGVAPATGDPAAQTGRDRMAAEAEAEARANLARTALSVRVDSGHRLDHLLGDAETGAERIAPAVAMAGASGPRLLADGRVQVTVRMTLTGEFAQRVLPADIQQIDSIQTMQPSVNGSVKEASGDARLPEGRPSDIHTGLVVDARGLDLNPALFPKIYDESGLEVYGSAFISREFAVGLGVSRYLKNMDTAVGLPRVADNPLVVKGLRTTRPARTDIVISNADASKIRRHSEHLSFLKKCRVLFVVE